MRYSILWLALPVSAAIGVFGAPVPPSEEDSGTAGSSDLSTGRARVRA